MTFVATSQVKDAIQNLASVQNVANQTDAKKGINKDSAIYSISRRLVSSVPFLKLKVETCTGRVSIFQSIIFQPRFRPSPTHTQFSLIF